MEIIKFISSIEEYNVNVDDLDEEQVKIAVTEVQNLMKDAFDNKDEFRTSFEHLKVTLRPITPILERFQRDSRNRSETYVFCFQNMWLPRYIYIYIYIYQITH